MGREWKGCVMKQRSMVAVELKTLHLYGLNNSFITDRHYNVIDVKKTKKQTKYQQQYQLCSVYISNSKK